MPVVRDALTRVEKGSFVLQAVWLSVGCQNSDVGGRSCMYSLCSLSFLTEISKDSATGLSTQSALKTSRHSLPSISGRQRPLKLIFCVPAAEPGTAEGDDEEGRAGNQWQSDRNNEETGGSCAATARPGGARETKISS